MIIRVLVPGRSFPRLSSAITLLRSRGRNVLVDSGASHSHDRLLQALGEAGLAPEEIDTVVSTHLHYDHCGNHLLFPEARYLVSLRDFTDTAASLRFYHSDQSPEKRDTAELLRSQHQTIKEFYARSIVREMTRNRDFYDALRAGDHRFVPLAAGTWLTEDIEVFPSPGHTLGHLSVTAHRARLEGVSGPVDVLIAGDALPTQGMLEEGGERYLELAADTALALDTRARLLRRFRLIVPGHGTLIDRGPSRAEAPEHPLAAGRPERAAMVSR